MRLSFPNGEHGDVSLDQGEISIGSAADDGVSLASAGLAARHATLRVDAQRGILLRLGAGSGGAHVNARPVREFAILRLGDVISLGNVQFLVRPDDERAIQRELPPPVATNTDPSHRAAASRVVLRGTAGAYHGRTFSLQDPLTVGRGADADVRLDDTALADQHARLEQLNDRVLLRDLGARDGTVVNGVPLRSAVLHPGDQIVFAQHRFVLEAPGLPPRGSLVFAPAPRTGMGTTQTMQAVQVPDPVPASTDPSANPSRFNYGWLLLAAVAIALALVAILIYAPR